MFLPFSGPHQQADPTLTGLIQHVNVKTEYKKVRKVNIQDTLVKKRKEKKKCDMPVLPGLKALKTYFLHQLLAIRAMGSYMNTLFPVKV